MAVDSITLEGLPGTNIKLKKHKGGATTNDQAFFQFLHRITTHLFFQGLGTAQLNFLFFQVRKIFLF
jgi:hypothetical protein